MPASVLRAGIKPRLAGYFLGAITCWLAAVTSFQSCKSTSGDQEDASETSTSDDDNESGDESDDSADRLKHPQKANAWATRVLVSTTTDHPQEKISQCMEQIAAIAKDAGNQDDMQRSIVQTRSLVAQNLPLYHLCYYQIAARLDDRLAQGGVLLTSLATQFFETTKAMWIMARALDAAAGGRSYFNYLKDRYIQISRDVFGRNVAPVGLPFDEKFMPGGGTTQPQAKPAGTTQP